MKFRDLMAPDTDPTDEELGIVVREARDLAISRRAESERRIREALKEAHTTALQNQIFRVQQGDRRQ